MTDLCKPRVLIVGNFFPAASGAHGVCAELADALEAAGHAVMRTSSLRPRIARLIDMVTTIWRHRHRYDVATIDVYSGLAFAWADAASRVLRLLGKPHALTLHGGGLPDFARRHPRAVTRLLRRAHIVTAPSAYLQTSLSRYRPDILLVPNPIRVSDYSFRLRERARPYLVWIRAFHDVYNPPLASRVVARLAPKHPGTRLMMAGPDKGDGSRLRAEQVAIEERVQNRVRFVGGIPRARVAEALDAADVFLNTARVDNTPISMLEAFASGLAVVTTDAGGIRALAEDGVDALVVPSNDAEAMSAAVDRLLTDPSLVRRLSANARAKALRFDWSRILPEWQRLFHTLTHTNHRTVRVA